MPPILTIDPTTFKSLSLSGRTALITGGSSGIGLSTALLYHSLGCNVILGDLNPPPKSTPSAILFQKCDVTSYADLLALFDLSRKSFNTYPDIVFANAGIGEVGDIFSKVSDEEILKEPKHQVVGIDLTAVANTVRIGWWGIKKNAREGRNGGGDICMTASVAGYMGQPGLAMYNGAKHGVVGLLRGLRYMSPKDNVRLSLVAPAITSTPLLSTPDKSYELNVASFVAAGVPMNTPERIAEVVVWVTGGKKGNGMGLMVQDGYVCDLEAGIAQSRAAWMGEGMANLYKGGKGVDVFVGLSKANANAKI